MKSIKDKEKTLLEDFAMLPEWEDKYNYIMDLRAELPRIAPGDKNEKTRVEGCQSASWLKAEKRDGRLYFTGDSEAILGQGVISMLLHLVNGHTPEEIAAYDFYLVDAIGLPQHLSPTRRMGLASVIQRIKTLAHENL